METSIPLFRLVTLRPPMSNKTVNQEKQNDINLDENSTTCPHPQINLKDIFTLSPLPKIKDINKLNNVKLYVYLVYYYLNKGNRKIYKDLIEEYIKREKCNKDSFIKVFEKKFEQYIELYEKSELQKELNKNNEKIKKNQKLKKSLEKSLNDGVKQIEPNGKILVENREYSEILTELDVEEISLKSIQEKIKDKINIMQKELSKEGNATLTYHENLTDLNNYIKNTKIDEREMIVKSPKVKSLMNTLSIKSKNLDEITKHTESELEITSSKLTDMNYVKIKLSYYEALDKKLKKEKKKKIEKFVYKTHTFYDILWKNSEKLMTENRINESMELESDYYDLQDDFKKNIIKPITFLSYLNTTIVSYKEDEKNIRASISDVQLRRLKKLKIREPGYVYIGNKWINLRIKDELSSYANKNVDFSFSIGDLRVVEHKTVGYLPDEIAHINNTQAGEKKVRETRRLKKIDSYESFMSDIETTKETDTQSTDKFSMEKAASEIENEKFDTYAGVKASGSLGSYSVSAVAGASYSNSVTNSNSTAQNISKELVKKTLDRVSKRVRTERSVRTIEEFEEKVKHVIDNTLSDGPKSYVYRWLNKLSRVSIKNYGKRLILEMNISNPAYNYLEYLIQSSEESSVIKKYPDPRLYDAEVEDELENGLDFTSISRENYTKYGDFYKVKLKAPPKESIIVSKSYTGKEVISKEDEFIEIPEGYVAQRAYLSTAYKHDHTKGMISILGRNVHTLIPDTHDHTNSHNGTYMDGLNGENELSASFVWDPDYLKKLAVQDIFELDYEEEKIPVSLFYNNKEGVTRTIEIKCNLSDDALKNWQLDCYNDLIKGYENLNAEVEAEKSLLNYELPTINPTKKAQIIIDELKKLVLDGMLEQMDNSRFEHIREIEKTYDWDNMSYELHPYFFSAVKDQEDWKKKFHLSDNDPMFERFLQASYATVRIPVHRNVDFEKYALNLMYEEDSLDFEEFTQDLQEITKFTHNAEGEEVAEPLDIEVIDTFSIPTDLIILEAGVESGVKIRPYPEKEELDLTDIAIPKKYSPGIISGYSEDNLVED